MKPSFHHRLVNGPFGDPCVHVRILWERRALLFDLGDISVLSPAEISRISDVFVTHTHIDHFIGFDLLLRSILRRNTPLHLYGPLSLLKAVEGKLGGYTWNLIEEYPAEIVVHAFDGGRILRSAFRARRGFQKESLGETESEGILLETPRFRVRAVVLDHGIPCLAFALEESSHINIDKDFLARKDIPVGPWLRDFKDLLRNGNLDSTVQVEGREYRARELEAAARITRGQKISYATDLAITEGNRERLVAMADGSDVFYCEAYFLDEDRNRAFSRAHLTAKECGRIARQAGARRLVPMHFSPRYSDCPERIYREATDAFSSGED